MGNKERQPRFGDIPAQTSGLSLEEFADAIRFRSDELAIPDIDESARTTIFTELETLCTNNPDAYSAYMQALVAEQQAIDQGLQEAV